MNTYPGNECTRKHAEPARSLAEIMGASVRPAVRNRKAVVRVGTGDVVGLSAEDIRNLKAAGSRSGYALPRFNPRTGRMIAAQWRSWQKLHEAGLAIIEGSGEADDLILTDLGKQALRQANSD